MTMQGVFVVRGGRPEQAAGQAERGARLASPTIPQVWDLLRDPLPEMAQELRVPGGSTGELREMIRPVADALGNMVRGSLSGLFDGPTTVRLDFSAPIQTVDLSRINGRADETVAMTLACVSSWGQAAIDEPGGPVRLVVRDELWRALRIPAMIRQVGQVPAERRSGAPRAVGCGCLHHWPVLPAFRDRGGGPVGRQQQRRAPRSGIPDGQRSHL
jgi:hypothetical protein